MQCLDTTLALTRGNPVGAWAALENLRLERESITSVLPAGGGNPPLIGQMVYTPGKRAARIVYILPQSGMAAGPLPALLDTLAWEAGNRGAHSLLADLEENHPAFEEMRRSGFGVYAWQRVWRLKKAPQSGGDAGAMWRSAGDLDRIAIGSLYQSLVPPLVQSAEPLTDLALQGYISQQGGELQAYIEVIYGPRGIYLLPLIHPAAADAYALLRSFLAHMTLQMGRPVYLAVRSHQAWLEDFLAEMGAETGERRALMVRHLVAQQRQAVQTARNLVVEKQQPAMITPNHGNKPAP